MKTEKVKSFQNPAISAPSDTGNVPGVTSNPTPILPSATNKSLLQIRDELKSQNPNSSAFDLMQSARQRYNAQLSVTNPASNPPPAQTGIAPLDTELQKLRDEKSQSIKDTYKNYSLAQADYQKNAGYYTNFE